MTRLREPFIEWVITRMLRACTGCWEVALVFSLSPFLRLHICIRTSRLNDTDNTTQKVRMEILVVAQAEMNAIIAERKIITLLTRNIFRETKGVCKLGEEVLDFSEKEKKQIVPMISVAVTGRIITILSLEGTKIQTFKAFKTKSYYRTVNLNLNCFQTNSIQAPLF